MVTKHKKPRQTEPGGLQKMEAAIAYSNAMLMCPKCDKPVQAQARQARHGRDRAALPPLRRDDTLRGI